MNFSVPTFRKVSLRLISRRTALTACVFFVLCITIAYSLGVSAESFRSLFASALTAGTISPGTAREITPGSSFAESAEPRFLAAESMDTTLATGRRGHTATLLGDGKVLVTGGNSDGSGEVYDPANDLSAPTAGHMNAARSGHTASRLSNGKILITGGTVGGDSVASTEVYDPSEGTFSTGPSMGEARSGHTATVLSNGNVLIAGGGSDTAEIFDGTSFTVIESPMVSQRTNASAVLMADGRVFIAGGTGSNTAEIFNPADGSFTAAGNAMTLDRARAHLRVLPDGKIQIIGGNNDGSMEIYDPAIDTIGAYAHVIPGTDTCASLPAGVKASQTRAALFYNGNADPNFDRSGHTITEVSGNKAVVIGGTDNAGNTLNAVTIFTSSPATITTDKLDYAPGETVTFTGTGFAPGETVRVVIHEDPHTHTERNFTAVADASGSFTGSYLVEEHDLNVHFIVAAKGLTSGLNAHTTFTDAQPTSVSLSPASVTVNQGSDAEYTIDVDMGGNPGSCTVTLSVSTALPTGTSVSISSPNPTTTDQNGDFSRTLKITTSNTTPVGSYPFTVLAATSSCQNGSPNKTISGTLVVTASTVNTTTNVSNAVATYGDASVTLNATVTPDSGPAIGSGSVTFTVKDDGTVVGSPVSDNSVVSGSASVSYPLPSGTNAGTYTIEATYNAGSGFNGSIDATPGTLTIGAKSLTASIIGNPTKPYDGNTNATLTSANFSLSGLVGTDNFTVTKSTGTYDSANAGARTVSTTLAAGDFTAVGATLAGNYTLPTTASGSGTINKATPTVTVGFAASPITYDGAAHPASITVNGVSGPLTLPADGSTAITYTKNAAPFAGTPTDAGSYTASATFTSANPNYDDASSSTPANLTINKANANCSVTGYNVTYDGNPHTATGTCTGVGGTSDVLAGLDLSGTTHTSAGSYANDPWTFTDVTGNYNDTSGTVADNIGKADATCTVSGVTVTYDGNAHGATGQCSGVGGPSDVLAGLNHGSSFTNVPGGTANWTFTDSTGNYNNQSGTASIVINKANATCSITGYNVTYNGNAHTATGACTGVGGPSDILAGLDLSGTTHTNAGSYPADPWTFTDSTGNYNNQNGAVADNINKANANCLISGYGPLPYDGAVHGATGTCTGVGGPSDTLAGLNLGASFTNVPGGMANWSFTDVTGNYDNTSGSVQIQITKANANCTVTAYNVTYDGSAHNATGSCLGVLGETLAGLDLTGTTHTNAGSYPTDPWTFTDSTGNYNDTSGTVADNIDKADATCTVDGVTVTYDGNAHGATGQCTGVGGTSDILDGLDLGVQFTNVSGGTAIWTFTDVTGNYKDDSGTAEIVINKANAVCTVNGVTVTYDGNAHGATGQCTGVGGPSDVLDGLNLGTSFTNVPGGTANWSFTDVTGNYNNQNGTASILINKANATCTITGVTVTYDGNAHGASGQCNGVGGPSDVLAGLNLGATFTNVPGGTANWAFTDVTGNYNNQSGTASIVINKATPTVSVTGGTYPYTGVPIPATGFAYGVGGTGDVLSPAVTFQYVGTGTTLYPATATPPTFVGIYQVTASFAGNSNYNSATNTASLTITTIYCFNGFLSPVGGSVEAGNGGSYNDPVRSFKLNSTIPFKFILYSVGCSGSPIVTGIHKIQLAKYSNATDSDTAIDATPTDAATSGNLFRLTGTEWHFNLDTKKTQGITAGTWLVTATLQDGSTKTVWISIKK